MKVFKSLILIFVLFCIIPSSGFASTAYYVDPSRTFHDPDEDGSYKNPWNSIQDVNDHVFSDGDDVYFKVGTKLDASSSLEIDWDGKEGNATVIGAYYGENKFGLNGNARPVIDGNGNVPSNQDNALIRYWNGTGHVTIKDLEIKDSGGSGIIVGYKWTSQGLHSDYNKVINCFINTPGREGIAFARASYGLIEDCEVYGACSVKNQTAAGYTYAGASIDITGMGSEKVTQHNTVRRCTVSYGWEGIGIYKGARYTTVEYSTVYDCRSYLLYQANSRDAVFRYNVIYETTEENQPPDENEWKDMLIASDCESHVGVKPYAVGGLEIYGNYLSGGKAGIAIIGNGNLLGVYQSNNKIYDNRIVACDYNFLFRKTDSQWANNHIYDNYSFSQKSGSAHANDYSPSGFTWTANFFDSSVSGNANFNSNPTTYSLANEEEISSLEPGTVVASTFSFVSETQEVNIAASSTKKVVNVSIGALTN